MEIAHASEVTYELSTVTGESLLEQPCFFNRSTDQGENCGRQDQQDNSDNTEVIQKQHTEFLMINTFPNGTIYSNERVKWSQQQLYECS